MSRSRPVSVSFEFFPPADAAMEKTLWESIRYTTTGKALKTGLRRIKDI